MFLLLLACACNELKIDTPETSYGFFRRWFKGGSGVVQGFFSGCFRGGSGEAQVRFSRTQLAVLQLSGLHLSALYLSALYLSAQYLLDLSLQLSALHLRSAVYFLSILSSSSPFSHLPSSFLPRSPR